MKRCNKYAVSDSLWVPCWVPAPHASRARHGSNAPTEKRAKRDRDFRVARSTCTRRTSDVGVERRTVRVRCSCELSAVITSTGRSANTLCAGRWESGTTSLLATSSSSPHESYTRASTVLECCVLTSVTELTADLRAEARQLEMDLFGPRPGSTASHRADRRASTVQRQERERDAQQWRARLRDRAPIGLGLPGSDN